MPTIPVTDQAGLLVDAQLNSNSGLARYLQDLAALKLSAPNLASLADLSLANLPVSSLQFGVETQPVAGASPISAGATGTLSIQQAPEGDDLLAAGQTYLSLGLSLSVKSDPSVPVGGAVFGVCAGGAAALAKARPFPPETKLPDALREMLGSYTVPLDAADLENLAPGTVVDVDARGNLTFHGSANLLATVSLPAPVGPLSVTSGNSLEIGASFTLSGEYEIRVGKTSDSVVRLAYRRKTGTEIELSASAEAGITAGPGQTDLVALLLGAVSSDPKADAATLQAAGLSAEQMGDIQGAIKAAVDRRLALAASFALCSLDARESAFLYEVDLGALDDAGRASVGRALAGDLTAWREDALPAGVRMLRSLFTTLRQQTHTFKVNLLGIYNFGSVSKLALKGSVCYEPLSGELVIADSASASRIQSAAVNFGADPDKLRQLLAESFLITAAYHSSALAGGPQLAIRHTYFHLHSTTNQQTMKDELDVAGALGLLVDSGRYLAGIDDFGRTAAYAETCYDAALATALFLNQDQPRPVEEYEQCGREAIQLLVTEGDPDSYRRQPAIDNDLWARMKASGQP